ncbi:MAG TPA: lipopolysaccharide heptosyltransferase I [Coxiellaceae bacterium]|nr:lipopolysaccharide heptosyltransferase I [Coxiellaceae bacterium]
MHILIIKTSSLGDIIHTFPAICDAHQAIPNLRIDWLIEEQFMPMVENHPCVHRAIACHWRHFNGNPLTYWKSPEWTILKKDLRNTHYDAIIDLQGLLKSALLVKLCRSKVTHGYSWRSAREPLSSLFYRHCHSISRQQNAILRSRQLLAQALNYACPKTTPHYNWNNKHNSTTTQHILLLTNTTWITKYWPRPRWITLGLALVKHGYIPTLTWGTPIEKAFVDELSKEIPGSHVLPKTNMADLHTFITHASGFVGVDTGLTHLATALSCPGVCLMGATDPNLTGPLGQHTYIQFKQLACSPCKQRQCQHKDYAPKVTPCMLAITPEQALAQLMEQIENKQHQ